MQLADTDDLGYGITCIDANYMRPGVASFYLLQAGEDCALVETGTVHSFPLLQHLMEARGIRPEQVRYVIPTHVHLDHAGGAGLMMARFPRATCLAHPRGARHLVDPARLVAGARAVYGDEPFERLYGDVMPVAESRMRVVEDGDGVELGGRRLEIRHTPGHADHHFCVWDETSRGWFTGDVFGISYPWFRTKGGDYAMPSTTPNQFRPEALCDSLALIGDYAPERVYLTHYGVLTYSPAVQLALVEQLRAYVDIARECAGDVAAIEAAIVDYSLARVRDLNAGAVPGLAGEDFHHDAGLNAQGLAIWYGRQAA